MRAYCRQRRWPLPRAVINAGFTMVEVLVALMIIATGLIAALRAAGGVTNGSRELYQRTLAGFCADNALAQMRLEHAWPPVGEIQFNCAQGNHDFIVQRITAATPNPNFRSVEMIVRDSAQTHEWARLVTVLPNEPR